MNKIVFKGKAPNDTSYIIRYLKRSDLSELLRYINELSKEKTFINLQGEEVSLKEEKEFINNSLKRVKNGEGVYLIVESGGKIVGISDITKKPRAEKHTAVFGITLSKDFRGLGVGKILMKKVLELANTISGLKIVRLVCFGENERALNLYKSLGFKEYGRLPGGLLHRGKPTDQVLMYYEVKT